MSTGFQLGSNRRWQSLKSPRPGDFDTTHLPVLNEVLPLFSMAVKRSVDELDGACRRSSRRSARPFTPWSNGASARPCSSVSSAGRPGADGAPAEIEPIVFREVYPLYALADIRGSSTQRAWAIQADALAGPLCAGRSSRFDHLQTFGASALQRIDAYRRALDPTLGVVYVRRKAFEESVTAINDEISAYVDLEEQAAQAIMSLAALDLLQE